ncbi:MAG: 2-hydroxyglutaryl-CoA dehydratase [Deltaproteobacteria bacterium]|nr:2-hydroxyglutaryl-CoA dehydratase [Deltaproteobacteria bacterium]MBW1952747.1 2-hydroxyglutaryl-CoA dehydratase [Deltaproteobacteria bacterium]MBW1986379.1 2-hydroxyglutaryl-CoA dehydratase [Deltaproteobacteria bacterium]MBW2133773.1 2-hydroxyglutaryl-CoA dehydratase [Deltaproteobacteria bacterium]
MSCAAEILTRAPLVGLDFGSRFVKLACTTDMVTFVKRKLDTLTFYRDYFRRTPEQVEIDWPRLGLEPPACLVATGYGKHLLQAYLPTITEIRAHFLGARKQTGRNDFILLEIGGQDTKVLYVKEGRVFDFLSNDRCAAGTGRYLENMARFLKMSWQEFTSYSQEPVTISNTCAIFGETELIGHLLDGVPLPRIAAGVNDSVARRALAMLRRYPCRTLVFVGGVARNHAVVNCLRQRGDYQVIIPPDPQFNGALGCCLEARKSMERVGETKNFSYLAK